MIATASAGARCKVLAPLSSLWSPPRQPSGLKKISLYSSPQRIQGALLSYFHRTRTICVKRLEDMNTRRGYCKLENEGCMCGEASGQIRGPNESIFES